VYVFLTRLGRLVVGIALVVAVTSVVGFGTLTDTVSVASKHSQGTSQLILVPLSSTDGLAHWGQQVTFKVSTTKTTEPHVSLVCSQSGNTVYQQQTGFYASYPWPWTQTMTLSSAAWSGGAAACTATLYYFSGSRTVTLTTLNFQVYA
jgi:hypothetical protein